MNSDKLTAKIRERGNAMIYVLLAVALLAALSMTLMRQSETGGDDLSQDQAELLAMQAIAYAASAKQVVDQMVMSGTPAASLDFILPSDPAFNTGSNIHKVYHPAGGGLNYRQADSGMFASTPTTPAQGWYFNSKSNVEWTPSTAKDIIFSAWRIHKAVCEEINKKITGNTAIPAVVSPVDRFVGTDNGAAADADLAVGSCPACEGHPTLCVSNAPGTNFAYYNILLAQ